MDCMCALPDRGLCLVKDNIVYDYDDAMERFPDWAIEIASSGDVIEGGKVVGNRYFAKPMSYTIDVSLGVLEEAKARAEEFYVEYVGETRFVAYDEETFNAFSEWVTGISSSVETESESSGVDAISDFFREEAILARGSRAFEERLAATSEPESAAPIEFSEESKVEEQEQEPLVIETQEPPRVIQAKNVVRENTEPKARIKAVVRVEPEEVVYRAVQTTPILPDTAFRPDGVPEICKGETWAQTYSEVNLNTVYGNIYCIENNWDKRGEYYIIDCVPKGVRYIHSDSLNYDGTFPIEECNG